MEKNKKSVPSPLLKIKQMHDVIYSIPDFIELSDIFSQAVEYALMDLSDASTDEDWFDDITVKRNIKELKEYQKLFQQVSEESMRQLGHIISLYEDTMNIMERYYDFSKTLGDEKSEIDDSDTSDSSDSSDSSDINSDDEVNNTFDKNSDIKEDKTDLVSNSKESNNNSNNSSGGNSNVDKNPDNEENKIKNSISSEIRKTIFSKKKYIDTSVFDNDYSYITKRIRKKKRI